MVPPPPLLVDPPPPPQFTAQRESEATTRHRITPSLRFCHGNETRTPAARNPNVAKIVPLCRREAACGAVIVKVVVADEVPLVAVIGLGDRVQPRPPTLF